MELLIEFVVNMIISCMSLELFDKEHTLSPAHMQSTSEAMRQNCTQHLRTDSTDHEGLSGPSSFSTIFCQEVIEPYSQLYELDDSFIWLQALVNSCNLDFQ